MSSPRTASPTVPTFVAFFFFAAVAGLGSAAAAEAIDWKTPPADAVRHPSGLVSIVLAKGQGVVKPDDNDLVSARFVGRTLDGREFANTYDDQPPRGFMLSQVFPGWREAMKLLVQGEKRRVWIPVELAPQGPASGAMPVGQPVVFDVELFGLIPIPPPPARLDAAVPEAKRLPSGASTLRLSEGTGKAHPIDTSAALVDYVLWTADGKVADSSFPRLRPMLVPLPKANAGLVSCIKEMVEGESRYCWLPAHVANAEWQGSPQGPLVFWLTLKAIGDASKMFEGATPTAAPPASGG